MVKTLFGLARDENHADRVLSRLRSEGFDTESISFLVYDKTNRLTRRNANGEVETNPEFFRRDAEAAASQKRTISHEIHSKAPEGAATGALAGGIVGGTLGLLAGLGAIAIPGLGVFVAAGPVMAALAGSGVGGSVGLLLGSLTGLGIPEVEAKRYVNDLQKRGRVLISVSDPNSNRVKHAKEILEQEKVEDISTIEAAHR